MWPTPSKSPSQNLISLPVKTKPNGLDRSASWYLILINGSRYYALTKGGRVWGHRGSNGVKGGQKGSKGVKGGQSGRLGVPSGSRETGRASRAWRGTLRVCHGAMGASRGPMWSMGTPNGVPWSQEGCHGFSRRRVWGSRLVKGDVSGMWWGQGHTWYLSFFYTN